MHAYTPSQKEIISTERKLWPEELCFSEAEFAARLSRVQAEIARQELQGVIDRKSTRLNSSH